MFAPLVIGRLAAALTLVSGVVMFGSASRAADCAPEVERFNAAVGSGNTDQAQQTLDTVVANSDCAALQVPMQRRLAAQRLKTAQDLMAKNRPATEYEAAVVAADRPQVLWQAAATLGSMRFDQRRFGEAARAFDRAIDIINNETATPTPPAAADINRMVAQAGQARILAANGGDAGGKPVFVATVSNTRDGTLGGVFTPRVRGIVPRAVPVPITFEYRSADLTPIGEEAGRELVRAIREQRPERVVVVGHTDVRGGEDYNQKLSKARAEKVATFLRDNGVTEPIDANGVGASEPVRLSDQSGLTQDDVYALNRRVEWRRN